MAFSGILGGRRVGHWLPKEVREGRRTTLRDRREVEGEGVLLPLLQTPNYRHTHFQKLGYSILIQIWNYVVHVAGKFEELPSIDQFTQMLPATFEALPDEVRGLIRARDQPIVEQGRVGRRKIPAPTAV